MMPAVLTAVKKEIKVTNGIPALTIESSEENPNIIDAEKGLLVHLPRREQRSLTLRA